MRILVISDLHANFVALEAVLAAAEGQYEAVWCLGDLVGYGPQPEACVARVRSLPGLRCLVGNHDQAVLGELDLSVFNHEARTAIQWTHRALSAESLAYLASLPPLVPAGDFTLAHASPRHPVWEYVLDCHVAAGNFARFDTPYCLVGHTHVPVVFVETGAGCAQEAPDYAAPRPLAGPRLIVNPGSVGQPRDSNPQAAYGLLDQEAGTWQHCRVPYDVAATQALMRAAGLPERLAARLAIGW